MWTLPATPCSPTRWPVMATPHSWFARAGATSRLGTGGPMRDGTSAPIRACPSISSVTASSSPRRRSATKGRTRCPGLARRSPNPANPKEPTPGQGSDAWLTWSEDKPVGEGHRNRSLWRHCMREAHHCDDFDALVDIACTANADYLPPLPDDEYSRLPARPGATWSAARTASGLADTS